MGMVAMPNDYDDGNDDNDGPGGAERRRQERSRRNFNAFLSENSSPFSFPNPGSLDPAALGHRIVWDTWPHVLAIIIPHSHTNPVRFFVVVG